jgi:hypothetical protein
MEKTVRKFLNMNFKKNTSKKIPTGRKQIYSAGSKAVSERRWQALAVLFKFNALGLHQGQKVNTFDPLYHLSFYRHISFSLLVVFQTARL